jgi:hypothetical protein
LIETKISSSQTLVSPEGSGVQFKRLKLQATGGSAQLSYCTLIAAPNRGRFSCLRCISSRRPTVAILLFNLGLVNPWSRKTFKIFAGNFGELTPGPAEDLGTLLAKQPWTHPPFGGSLRSQNRAYVRHTC